MKIYTIDENLICRCGHPWKEHKHGAISNLKYSTYPLTIHGCIASDCEYRGVKKRYFSNDNDKKYCKCDGFKPSSHNVQKLVEEWVKVHG